MNEWGTKEGIFLPCVLLYCLFRPLQLQNQVKMEKKDDQPLISHDAVSEGGLLIDAGLLFRDAGLLLTRVSYLFARVSY